MRFKTLLRFVVVVPVLISGMPVIWAQDALPSKGPIASQALSTINPPQLDFERTGPQVGEQVPDLRLHTLKGEEQRFSAAWQGGPALLVTSSLTCPKSRSRWPELKELVDKYSEKLNVVIVYVIEAHPVGSVCPYKGVEDITPENQRDGILRKQPTTLEDRLELAQEFKRLLRISAPIYVDNLQDEAWKVLGTAPNLALLVDQEGLVVARSGWFEGAKSQAAIEKHLSTVQDDDAAKGAQRQQRRQDAKRIFAQLENAGFERRGLSWHLDDVEPAELAKILNAVPAMAQLVLQSDRGHEFSSTLLMDAVYDRKVQSVKLLLEHGADVNAGTESFDSVFQVAAQVGDVPIAQLLLDKGADPKFPKSGRSPLHEAALRGHVPFVRLLLELGVGHDFYSAIALGEVELVQKGLSVDPSRSLRPDGASRMPLDYAAANGQLEIARLLLAHGAPVVRDRYTLLTPPLHRAIARNDVAMAELLLAAGSSPDTSFGYAGEGIFAASSEPAIHLAIEQKNLEIVKRLLAYKVDLKARNTRSQTALHVAAAAGQAEIAATLIKAGADVNAPQLGYSTPCGPLEERIPSYTTPLHFAADSGDLATLKVLIAAGAEVNAATKGGETPLMRAAYCRRPPGQAEASNLRNLEFLLASGADVNARGRNGASVLDWVMQAHKEDDSRSKQDLQAMAALLKKHGAKAGASKSKNAAQEAAVEM